GVELSRTALVGPRMVARVLKRRFGAVAKRRRSGLVSAWSGRSRRARPCAERARAVRQRRAPAHRVVRGNEAFGLAPREAGEPVGKLLIGHAACLSCLNAHQYS